MKAKLMLALSAILLIFVIISCDTSTTYRPQIPVGLVGEYTFGGHTVVITGTGAGTVNGDTALFSVDGSTLTVTMDGQTITVQFAVTGNMVSFSAVAGPAGDLLTVFTAFASAESIERRPIGTAPAPPVIPETLVGNWVLVNDVPGEASAGTLIFVIESDGSGTVRNSVTLVNDPAEWSVTGNQITLTIDYRPAFDLILSCMYTWAINAAGHLVLSNAVPADAPSEALVGFVAFSPFERTDDVPPGIDDFEWTSTIPSQYTGIWEATELVEGRRVFAIRANGSGYVYRSTIPGFGTASYQFSAGSAGSSDKLLLTITDVGRVMFDISINNDQLILSSPVTDGITSADDIALGAYALFSPLNRTSPDVALPFDYSAFTWHPAIPETHTGTWNFPGFSIPGIIDLPPIPNLYTINADGTGTAFVAGEVNAPVPAFFALSTDNEHLLLTIPLFGGRILFEVSNPVDGTLVLTNAIADAGGELMYIGYGFLSPLDRD